MDYGSLICVLGCRVTSWNFRKKKFEVQVTFVMLGNPRALPLIFYFEEISLTVMQFTITVRVVFLLANSFSIPSLLSSNVWSASEWYDCGATHICLYYRWCRLVISSCEEPLIFLIRNYPLRIQSLAWLTSLWSVLQYAKAPRIGGQM